MIRIWSWERGFFFSISVYVLEVLNMKTFDFGVLGDGFSVSVETSASGVYVSFVLSRLIDSKRENCTLC